MPTSQKDTPPAAKDEPHKDQPQQKDQPHGDSVDGPTAAEEQRARSAQIEAAGAGKYPPDERSEDEKASKPVQGVSKPILDEKDAKPGKK